MPFASRFSDRNVLLSFHLLNHAVLYAIQSLTVFIYIRICAKGKLFHFL
jgi:hypothetical protein